MRVLLWLSLLILLGGGTAARAQDARVVRGQVLDDHNAPVSYGTVRLEAVENNTLLQAVQTDSVGRFVIPAKAGVYVVRINYLGYKPYSSAPVQVDESMSVPPLRIVLSPDQQVLQEVKVTAARPLVERLLDKTVVNVEGSAIAAGNSALDVLTLSPGIILNNGRLILNGKGGVTVMIDQKPTYLSNEQLNLYLKGMNATEIKQIEIITNPSARYDAQGTGGIINIVLKQDASKGMQATLVSGVGYGYLPRYNTGVSLNYRKSKFSLFTSYNLSRSNQVEKVIGNRQLFDEQISLDQENDIRVKGTNHLLRGGVDYRVNANNVVGVQVKTTFYREAIPQLNTTIKRESAATDSTFVTSIDGRNSLQNLSFNLNHTLVLDSARKQLTTSLDYARFAIASTATYQTARFTAANRQDEAFSSLLSDLPYVTTIYTAKTDYVQALSAAYKLEAGLKLSDVATTNTLKYFDTTDGSPVLDPRLSNEFAYRERINAAYVSLRHQGVALSYQLGLRSEQTFTRGESATLQNIVNRHYLNFFPSLFTSYVLSPKQQVSFNYSRRILRPLYKDLNPFTYYIDPFSSLQGNPYLRPQYAHVFELTYLFNQKVSVTSSYSRTTDVIIQVPQPVPGTFSYVLRKDNISTFNNFGMLLNYPLTISKKINTNISLNMYRSIYSSALQGESLNNSRSTAELNVSGQITLPKELVGELSGYYVSPFVQGYYRTAGIGTVNAGIKRSFYDKRLTVKLNVNDLFNTYRVRNTADFGTQRLFLQQTFNTRVVNFSLTYKVTQGQKIDPARKVDGSLEEQKRVK